MDPTPERRVDDAKARPRHWHGLSDEIRTSADRPAIRRLDSDVYAVIVNEGDLSTLTTAAEQHVEKLIEWLRDDVLGNVHSNDEDLMFVGHQLYRLGAFIFQTNFLMEHYKHDTAL